LTQWMMIIRARVPIMSLVAQHNQGEFTQSLLSCYLLSNENTLLPATQGERSGRIALP
jgi:hypothetical protein